MSDHLRAPFDDDALDGYWDAFVSGQQPADQLPSDVGTDLAASRFLDPAPQAGTVRHRAWAETWNRIQSTPPEQEFSSMHAIPSSSNHRQPQSVPVAKIARVATSPGRIDHRWAVVAALIAATLLAFAAYGFFDPIRFGSGQWTIIPAAVVQEVSSHRKGTREKIIRSSGRGFDGYGTTGFQDEMFAMSIFDADGDLLQAPRTFIRAVHG